MYNCFRYVRIEPQFASTLLSIVDVQYLLLVAPATINSKFDIRGFRSKSSQLAIC